MAFDLPANLCAPGVELRLDLGTVKNLAQVRLNGSELGVLWKPPFRIPITRAAHAGRNELEVRITNLWVNRLIGDQQRPVSERVTWTTFTPYSGQTPLLPSGLLGPVKVVPAVRLEFH